MRFCHSLCYLFSFLYDSHKWWQRKTSLLNWNDRKKCKPLNTVLQRKKRRLSVDNHFSRISIYLCVCPRVAKIIPEKKPRQRSQKKRNSNKEYSIVLLWIIIIFTMDAKSIAFLVCNKRNGNRSCHWPVKEEKKRLGLLSCFLNDFAPERKIAKWMRHIFWMYSLSLYWNVCFSTDSWRAIFFVVVTRERLAV